MKWSRRQMLWAFHHPLRVGVVLTAILVPDVTASASSIVYIKDSNLWIATPDGTTQRQITTNGTPAAPYYSPSQADDGAIAVGWGSRVYRIDQHGTLLGPPIPTLISDKPPNVYAVGPFNPRLSPDDKTLVYWIGFMTGSYDPGCNCYLSSPVESVVYAHADGSGPIGFSRYWQTPSWIDNGHALVFAPDNRLTPQVGVATLTALGNEQGWFNDDGEGFEGYTQNVDDGEIDRGGRKLALVRGMQAERLSIYAVSDFSTQPVLMCEGAQPAGRFSGPTWSPDGRALAWYEDDGVWVTPAPADLSGLNPCAEFAPQLLLPGASEPRWGVADVLVVSPTLMLTPSSTPTPTATPVPTTTATPAATRTASPSATPTVTHTALPGVTATPSHTPTYPVTQTPTVTATTPAPPATASPTLTPTSSATVPAPSCVGDCDGSQSVTVDEILGLISIALGSAEPTLCAHGIAPGDIVDVALILRAVDSAVRGCPAAGAGGDSGAASGCLARPRVPNGQAVCR